MVCRLTFTAAIADVNWTENRNWFFLVYICMQMYESTFVVRSRSHFSSPFALPHANLHLLLIHPNAAHIPFKLLCTLAMQYGVRRITYSLNESLCRIIWWRRRRWTIGRAKRKMDYVNCVLGALASRNSYLLSNERIKKRSPRCHRFSFLLPLRSTPLIACDAHVWRILFIRAYEFFMKNSRFNFYLHAKKDQLFSLSLRFQICTHKINIRFFPGYFLCGTICVLVH